MACHREADCCEYREERRRLALKKLQKKKLDKNVTQKRRIDDCDDDDDDATEEKLECEEKRAQRVHGLLKLLSEGDEMMGRIRPSIKERDKYAMNLRHIRCFLEPTEIAELEYEEKLRAIGKKLSCHPCQTSTTSKTGISHLPGKKKKNGKKRKKEKEKEKGKGKKPVTNTEKEEPSGATEQQPVNAESNPDADKKNPEQEDGKDKKPRKSEFWCRKVEKKVDVKIPDRGLDEIDCKDSVCSFDSQIDLSGLALTKKDMKKIAEMRRSRMASKDQSKEAT